MKAVVLLAFLIGGCGEEVVGSGARDGGARDARAGDADAAGGASDAGVDASAAPVDLDGDGLDDADEAAWASAVLPFLSIDPDDGCPLGGIVYRMRPHPADATLVAVTYVHLFEEDCGLNGHVGDNEAFGVTFDPALPGPAGMKSVKAISHQGTPCQRVTECGVCDGLDACTAAGGEGRPVVYSSKDKHGGYVSETSCDLGFCLDACVLADAPRVPPMVNAGEPDAPLVDDLTAAGLITEAAGWTRAELFAYDPWGAAEFGSAGVVSGDLTDEAFVGAACR